MVWGLAIAAGPWSDASFTATSSGGASQFSTGTWNAALAVAGAGPIATSTSSGTVTVTYPSGVNVDDLLLLVEINSANQAITTPAGWALLTDTATSTPAQYRLTVWWRLAAGEVAVNLAVKTNASGANALVLRLDRASGYPPVPVLATSASATGTAAPIGTIVPTPDITTDAPDATVISIVAVRAANPITLSSARGFTVRVTGNQVSTGQPVAVAVSDLVVASPSAVPSPSWAQGGTAAQWAWATVAFA